MQTVSMLEFRQHAQQIVRRVRQGQSVILTYRGRPAARLEPLTDVGAQADDRFYRLADLADGAGESLSNREVDEAVYGQ